MRECPRKRGRNDAFSAVGSKACREKMRREKLNDRFSELCSLLEPDRPVKTDKLAILGDAIRVLNELKSESQEYKEMNEKLLEEIKTLKVRAGVYTAFMEITISLLILLCWNLGHNVPLQHC
ncbi:transcription factor bHLH34-like isoform X2 [Olea europaea var. sylvestris]|uniref:transcription factor bHLH34-like isoform X2 n=1 Tax=Olea europaea var. sylvestris TaxID=158386 RepID=UPI000C1D6FAD|nr:transcription factor bHLH34-like isoform X2 [Olea europaea var. sylvestris]